MEFNQRENEIERFIKAQGNALLKYIYSMMKQHELAEDIYQETLLSAFIRFETFEQKSSLKSWIYKIAMNKCKDEWKKQKVRQRYLEERKYRVNQKEIYNETEAAVFEKSLHQELLKKINELPNRYQQSLLLYYYHDYSMLDISEKTALPLSTVKTHLKRGKDRLRSKVVVALN